MEEIHVPKETVASVLKDHLGLPSEVELRIGSCSIERVTRDWNFKSRFELLEDIIYTHNKNIKDALRRKLPRSILIKTRYNRDGSRQRYETEKLVGLFSSKHKWPTPEGHICIFPTYYNVGGGNTEEARGYLDWLDKNQILIMAYQGRTLDEIIFEHESSIEELDRGISEGKARPETAYGLMRRKIDEEKRLSESLESGLRTLARFHTLAASHSEDLPGLIEPREDFYLNKIIGYINWIMALKLGLGEKEQFNWKPKVEDVFRKAWSTLVQADGTRSYKMGWVRGVIHGDSNPANLLSLDNGHVLLIDGESVKRAPYSFDVAYLLINNLVRRPISEIEKYIEDYLTERQRSEQELRGAVKTKIDSQPFVYSVLLSGLYGSIRSAATAARTRIENEEAFYLLRVSHLTRAMYEGSMTDNLRSFARIANFIESEHSKYGLPDKVKTALGEVRGILTEEVPILRDLNHTTNPHNNPVAGKEGDEPLAEKRGYLSRVAKSLGLF